MKNKKQDTLYCDVREDVIKSAHPILSMKTLRYLYQFINERYTIHVKKDVLHEPAPWTDDEVLAMFRFTNVRREHDRETKWLIKHVTSNKALSYKDKLLNAILFRLFNKHETSELIGMPIEFSKYGSSWDPEQYRKLFEDALKEDPKRVFFTGAFHTVGMKMAFKQYIPKGVEDNSKEMRVMYFMKYLLDYDIYFWLTSDEMETQEHCFNLLKNFTGIGDFLGYQIFVDMTYIKEFPFSENEFTVAGPGCRMGLNYLFKDRVGMSYEECLFWVRDNIDRLFREKLNKPWDPDKLFVDLPEWDRRMNVMSLENCFCELSKYIRAKEGTGRPRKVYKPSKEEL